MDLEKEDLSDALTQNPREDSAAPARVGRGVQIRQTSQGGVNIGSIGSIQGGFNLSVPAPDKSPGPAPTTVPGVESLDLRVLLLCANPDGTSALRLDEEARAIDLALRRSTEARRCVLVQKWAVRVGELQEHLVQAKPGVVHFSVHGRQDRTIALQGEDGVSRPVGAAGLARLLGSMRPRPRCVVLNACYTEAHGKAIAESIDCVVGMSGRISDGAALRFSAAFYLALGSGASVLEAFEQGRSDIELGELREDEVPVLIANGNCKPADICFLRSR